MKVEYEYMGIHDYLKVIHVLVNVQSGLNEGGAIKMNQFYEDLYFVLNLD